MENTHLDHITSISITKFIFFHFHFSLETPLRDTELSERVKHARAQVSFRGDFRDDFRAWSRVVLARPSRAERKTALTALNVYRQIAV